MNTSSVTNKTNPKAWLRFLDVLLPLVMLVGFTWLYYSYVMKKFEPEKSIKYHKMYQVSFKTTRC
ncbi:hypothetical protein [Runella zeae]|uniref:hypothetical protein n=1 Tax=Runella zeae TaxID=94255 RepID=UPI0004242AE5|nr:hypothetical protein [Runella zeae]